MTRIQQAVLWTLAVIVLGYVAYVPRFHLVVATPKGIVMGQGIGGAEGFSDRRNDAGESTSERVGELMPMPTPAGGLKGMVDIGGPALAGARQMSMRMKSVQVVIQSNQERIEATVKKLREARSEEEKQAAERSLRTILARIFAADMEARDRQAREIETRLDRLRQQYQARENAKDEIIDLQLQVLENEAAGLGFPAVQLEPRGSGEVPL